MIAGSHPFLDYVGKLRLDNASKLESLLESLFSRVSRSDSTFVWLLVDAGISSLPFYLSIRDAFPMYYNPLESSR